MTAPRNVNRCTPCLDGAHARCSGSAGNIGCGCVHAAPAPQHVVPDEPEPARPERLQHERLRIEHGWLVLEVDEHTCGAGGELGHEPSCGMEPVMTLAELDELLTVVGETGAPINRPREVVAAIEERGRQRGVAPFRDLFSGGPDTTCRTRYRDEASLLDPFPDLTECVEVPLDDLRAAFREAGDSE